MEKSGSVSNGKILAEESTTVQSKVSSTLNALLSKDQWSSMKKLNLDIVSKLPFSKGISNLKKCTMPETFMKNLNFLKRKSTKKSRKINPNHKNQNKLKLNQLLKRPQLNKKSIKRKFIKSSMMPTLILTV